MAMFENSRYLHTKMLKRIGDDEYSFQIRTRYTFNADKGTYYEWVDGDTLDGLSYRKYGVSALRWAILDANPKYRTEFDIKNGDLIFIPDFEEVVNLVNVNE